MDKRIKAMTGLALAAVLAAQAQTVEIQREPLGSGEPGGQGFEAATPVGDPGGQLLFHVPQYLPGYPTAASIWPRVVRVRCRDDAGVLRCEGYNWLPAMGRAEYLFFIPVIAVTEPAPAPAPR